MSRGDGQAAGDRATSRRPRSKGTGLASFYPQAKGALFTPQGRRCLAGPLFFLFGDIRHGFRRASLACALPER